MDRLRPTMTNTAKEVFMDRHYQAEGTVKPLKTNKFVDT